MKTINLPVLSIPLFFAILLIGLMGWVNSAAALALGFVFGLLFEHPFPAVAKKAAKQLLKIAVIGLGFGISFQSALAANQYGLGVLISSMGLTLVAGFLLAKLFGLQQKLSFLITSGTAICGGSAIAAVAPVIKAESTTISVALAIIFTLNSAALLIFPAIGQWFGLSQTQFGLWSAIAIHDTSSVVGAAMIYGDEALATATTLKLTRALWIIPLAFLAMLLFKNKGEKLSIPYFIGGFVLAVAVNSLGVLPTLFTETTVLIAKRLLVITLFLIGSSLSLRDLKTVGLKPFLFALVLWLIISSFSLIYILQSH